MIEQTIVKKSKAVFPEQSLLEKADILLSTVSENSEPLSSLSILDTCLNWYSKLKKQAFDNKNSAIVVYCKNRIYEVRRKRNAIQSNPSFLNILSRYPGAK